MTRKPLTTVLSLILLLSLPILACSTITNRFSDSDPAPGLLATEPPADVPAGEGAAGGEFAEPAGPESLDLATLASGLQDVNSYRVTIEIRAEDAAGSGTETVTMFMENATVVDPPATQTDISIAGVEEPLGLNTLQFIAVDGMVYTTLPGIGCVSGGTDSFGDETFTNPFADIFATSGIIGDVRGARRQLPDENINGVESYHFVFDETAIQDPDNSLEEVEGHIYIAKEEGYVVRLVMDGTGRVDLAGLGQESGGTIHLEMNTRDVNQPLDIQPPADCDTFNLDEFELPDFDLDLDATTTP